KNALLLGLFSGLITNAHPVGLLNVGAIYLTLLIALLMEKKKADKIKMLGYAFISGILALLVFYPVYAIVAKTSDMKSFWVPAATYEGIKGVFTDLMSRSELLAGVCLALAVAFVVLGILRLFSSKEGLAEQKSKMRFSFILLSIWVFMVAGVLIIKSYVGVSMILNRYFIGVLPAIILISAIALSLIPNKIIRNVILAGIVAFSLYNIFIVRRYYTEISKAQYDKITAEILSHNVNHDKVFSAYGWLMSYYLNPDYTLISEITLEAYITAVRNHAVEMESFWYLDGNSRPYSLSNEDQLFLDENYITDYKYDMYDTWARHYTYKKAVSPAGMATSQNNAARQEQGAATALTPKTGDVKLYIKDFSPLAVDGSGNLMIFANGAVKSKTLQLSKGEYVLTINGNSLPEAPIQGQNAHLTVKLNDAEIASYYLSEKSASKQKRIPFGMMIDKSAVISLVFDNDLEFKEADRNIVIYSIDLQKQ
ncbi:MAG TPA: hypothetical protein VK476_03900, partial [Flavobacterium sp.]|nr:hypothetical protein [Flavobacterium sp.]